MITSGEEGMSQAKTRQTKLKPKAKLESTIPVEGYGGNRRSRNSYSDNLEHKLP